MRDGRPSNPLVASLGADGFLYLDDAVANHGLLDRIIAALE